MKYMYLYMILCISFHSCAWRHCGAQADAQEAISELYNSVGLFEPFECLFTLDIIERSLRDILAVIPLELKPDTSVLKPYVPYKSQPSNGESEYGGQSSIDNDFLNTLGKLRNNF